MISSGGPLMTVVILLFSLAFQLTDQLKFSAVQIPSLVQRNSNCWLACQFQLDHDDQLYSVKWYRNNEEFYRLLAPPQSAADSAAPAEDSNGQQQQHYFPQPGINVMMSSSNATHVRLLNASLESEGVFACEISTQNLSTIRYEKEIRVYALPQTRLNIIGSRNRYALGDRVDLICASDFSRPRPALAWFINGQRISQQANSWFEQELETQAKLNEPTLFRLNLRLSFRLTWELLELASSQAKSNQTASGGGSGSGSGSGSGNQRPINQPQPGHSSGSLPPLELQCRYRLAEVSDVTYNELALTTRQLAQGQPPTQRPQSQPLPAESTSGWSRHEGESPGELEEGDRKWASSERLARRWMRAGDGDSYRIQKSADGAQVVTQGDPRALRSSLRSLMEQQPQSCQLGSLALTPDDPLVVRQPPERIDQRQKQNQDQVEMIRVNCLTISALMGADDAGRATGSSGSLPLVVGGAHHPSNGGSSGDHLVAQCSDPSARRRTLVSGKSLPLLLTAANEPSNQRAARVRAGKQPPTSAAAAAATSSRPPLVAYLSLPESANNNGHATNSPDPDSGQRPEVGQYRQFASASAAADSSDSLLLLPLEGSGASSKTPLAPPLLEWFINNQEAPRNSTSYSPDLPLSRPATTRARLTELEGDASREAGGKGDAAGAEVPPPPIDYADYFANFDSRPLRQQVALNLKPDKRHFMTPDSTLRLRCSSTQAQVLAADQISLNIVPLASSANLSPAGANWQVPGARLNKQQQQQQQQQRQRSNQQVRASRVSSPVNPAGKSAATSRTIPPSATILTPLLLLLAASFALGLEYL